MVKEITDDLLLINIEGYLFWYNRYLGIWNSDIPEHPRIFELLFGQ